MSERQTAEDYLNGLDELEPDAIQWAKKAAIDAKEAGKEVHNLGIGVTKDEEGNDVPIKVFKEAENDVRKERKGVANYVPPVSDYLDGMADLIFDGNKELTGKDRLHLLDAHGGTNGDFMMFMFWRNVLEGRGQFVHSDGGWVNYPNMINQLNTPAPNGERDQLLSADYLLADPDLRPTLIDLTETLSQSALDGRIPIVITQNGPQNGLGIHRDEKFWDKYLELIKHFGGVIHFDDPYAGMGSNVEELEELGVEGAMKRDWYVIRKAAEMGIPFTLASSLSKTGGLYGKRVAVAGIHVPKGTNMDKRVRPNMNLLGRAVNSFTSDSHLAAGRVLASRELRESWFKALGEKVFGNIHRGKAALEKHAPNKQILEIIQRARGMFLTLPMNREEADRLAQDESAIITVPGLSRTLSDNPKHGIEVTRMNVAGILQTHEDEVAARVMKALRVA